MCGIIFAKSLTNKPVRVVVEERYMHQRLRGTEGFGFVGVDGDDIVSVHSVDESHILKALRDCKATEILFHHRYPTSTDNVINACHPFFGKAKDGRGFYLVHNGVLHNEDEMKLDHDKRVIKYSSMQPDGRFNDSECLVHEFALFMGGEKETFDAIGSIAIVVIETDKKGKPTKLHFARNYGSPLKKVRTRKTIQLASQGYGVDVPTGHLYTMDYKTTRVTEIPFVMESFTSVSNYSSSSYRETEDGRWVSKLWKEEKYDYVLNEETGEVEEVPRKLISSISEVIRNQNDDDGYDEDWKAFEMACSGLSLDQRVERDHRVFHSLPTPPLLSISQIYEKFGNDMEFDRGLDDGETAPFTKEDYKWITDLVLEKNEELKYLNGVLTLARDDTEVQDIADDIVDASRDFKYWMGVSTRMYELSCEY